MDWEVKKPLASCCSTVAVWSAAAAAAGSGMYGEVQAEVAEQRTFSALRDEAAAAAAVLLRMLQQRQQQPEETAVILYV